MLGEIEVGEKMGDGAGGDYANQGAFEVFGPLDPRGGGGGDDEHVSGAAGREEERSDVLAFGGDLNVLEVGQARDIDTTTDERLQRLWQGRQVFEFDVDSFFLIEAERMSEGEGHGVDLEASSGDGDADFGVGGFVGATGEEDGQEE